MVRVKGSFHRELNGGATGEIERLQDSACTDWISREFPARCRTFDPDKIASEISKLPTQQMDYCIDRFEYPNVLGQNPMIVATFREAEAICKKDSKRLCTENEWTFACEGEEARPYPYGWTRDTTACVIDRAWRPFTEGALQPRDGKKAREELDRLWQGEPSGSRGACRSPFGVYDMTGNVDEWTRSVNSTGYSSVLKGGYWGPVRARCRPATRAHNEDFVAYQQSFRCCDASNAAVPAPPATPPVAVLVDAGPTTTSLFSGDAGPPRKTADLEVEWGTSDRDEVDAITKARVALCSANAATAADPSTAAPSIGASFAVIALVVLRRRRS
jgi:formylglycine-generating enzyme